MRKLNWAFSRLSSSSLSSAVVLERNSLAFMVFSLAHITCDESGGHRQFCGCQAECFTREFLADPFHFIEHTTRLNLGDPKLGVPLTASHANLGRFLGNGLVRKHTDPKDRKSTRLNSSHVAISYAVFCVKKTKRTKSRADGEEE